MLFMDLAEIWKFLEALGTLKPTLEIMIVYVS